MADLGVAFGRPLFNSAVGAHMGSSSYSSADSRVGAGHRGAIRVSVSRPYLVTAVGNDCVLRMHYIVGRAVTLRSSFAANGPPSPFIPTSWDVRTIAQSRDGLAVHRHHGYSWDIGRQRCRNFGSLVRRRSDFMGVFSHQCGSVERPIVCRLAPRVALVAANWCGSGADR